MPSSRRKRKSVSRRSIQPDEPSRAALREAALQQVGKQMRGTRWSPRLLSMLLDELFVTEDVSRLLGSIARLPIRRYPEAVAIAVLLRHAWRRDTLAAARRRLLGGATRT